MLRTIAVWKRAPFVTALLIVASLGQWGLLFHNVVAVRGGWNGEVKRCLINAVPPVFFGAMHLYSKSSAHIVYFSYCCAR